MKTIILIFFFFYCQNLQAQRDSITYFPNGKIASKGQLVNGVLQGVFTIYYENGNVKGKFMLKDGSPEGKTEFFYEDGSKAQEYIIENGQAVSVRLFESLDDLFYMFREENSSKIGLESKSTGKEVLPPVYDGIQKMGKEYYTIIKDRIYYGLMHQSGKVVIPAIYDEEIKNFTSDKPFPAKKNGKFGYLNAQGKEVVPFIYDWASDFSDLSFGYARVESDDKYGMIDQTGKVIVPVIYDDLGTASDGLISAEMNGKKGFIDKNGKAVVPFIYDRLGDFSEGLAVVGLNYNTSGGGYETKYGYIDKTGKVVIPITYIEAGDFKNGQANVQLTKPTLTKAEAESENRAVIIAEKIQHHQFYIDKTGKRVN